ncbi:hypothetical protein [Cellulomonas sp. URHE0023]|uniref:hypothetical protein n=1 Tax=Cellulomonas sp. URHE0023 TaxID=1380354 RepID=UPI00047F44CB|nr:hypothetical protein [Cellulomonas sp. URHE0023]
MTTFIAGGTGKTGRRVAARLEALGHSTRIGSRNGTPPFDWDRPDTWDAALDGVERAYIAYAPDVAVPSAPEHLAMFGKAAAHLSAITLLSGRGEPQAQEAEAALRSNAPQSTVLRASWFAQNFSEGLFVDDIVTGRLALPVGDVGEPFLDADDLADAAVATLVEKGHAGRLYELTGPRLLSFADAVHEIADAAGRAVTFQTVTPQEYATTLEGAPPDVVELVLMLFRELFDGRNAHLETGVADLLGREPRDFRAFAQANREAWR